MIFLIFSISYILIGIILSLLNVCFEGHIKSACDEIIPASLIIFGWPILVIVVILVFILIGIIAIEQKITSIIGKQKILSWPYNIIRREKKRNNVEKILKSV